VRRQKNRDTKSEENEKTYVAITSKNGLEGKTQVMSDIDLNAVKISFLNESDVPEANVNEAVRVQMLSAKKGTDKGGAK